MAHEAIPSNISIVAMKKETTQGVEATGTYRQALVENFTANTETDRSGFSLIAGHKGQFGKNESGSHVNVDFTILVGKAGTDVITLLDVMYMIMDNDTVTGTDPYNHKMTLQGATVAKPSFSIYHDDGRSNYALYTGFVINTCSITINKEEGTVKAAINGFAHKELATTSKTVDTLSTCGYYSANTAIFSIGGTQVDNFKSIGLEFNCATRVYQSLNETPYPANIDGTMLDLKVSLEGEWNEASGQLSDTLKEAFLNATTQTDAFVIGLGASVTDDYFTLTLPRWEIETETHKNLSSGEMLNQTLDVYPVTCTDVATNGFYAELDNTISANASAL